MGGIGKKTQHLKHLSFLYFLSMTPPQQQVSEQFFMSEGITLLTASPVPISEAPRITAALAIKHFNK